MATALTGGWVKERGSGKTIREGGRLIPPVERGVGGEECGGIRRLFCVFLKHLKEGQYCAKHLSVV
jgi:hypothetical protein